MNNGYENMRYGKTAERIREAMKKKRVTQQQLADRTGISKSSISQYINGRNIPGSKNADALAQYLSVEAAWIMGFGKDEDDKREVPTYDPDIQIFVDLLPKLTPEQRSALLNMVQTFVGQNDMK